MGIDTSFDASVVLHPSSCHLFSLPHCASHKLLPDPRTAIQSSAILSRALTRLGETWDFAGQFVDMSGIMNRRRKMSNGDVETAFYPSLCGSPFDIAKVAGGYVEVDSTSQTG